MTTVRRPFLDAYRHAEVPQPASRNPSAFANLGSALAMASPLSDPTAYEGSRHAAHEGHTAARETPRAIATGMKRPLSSFLHNFDQPSERAGAQSPRLSAKWPRLALELLAVATPAYDKLIAAGHRGTNHGTLIGVVGCGPGLGTTTTAICLALRSATHGASTLLVDADLASPSLAERLELSVSSPWIRSLKDGISLERTIVSGGEVAIDLLLAEPQSERELDPWARFHVGNAAGQMRRRYQRTLIDLGHHLTEAFDIIAALAIDEIVVVSGPATTAEELEQVVQSLASAGHHVTGIAKTN